MTYDLDRSALILLPNQAEVSLKARTLVYLFFIYEEPNIRLHKNATVT